VRLSQNSSVRCFSSVDTTNEAVAEVGFSEPVFDLETIFRAQYERIARVIAGVIRDPARAEELAVEVFLKWERSSKVRSEGAEGWLCRAAVRVALNELRRKALRGRYERLLIFRSRGKTGESPPDEIYAAQEERKRVHAVLSAIGRRKAELLLLRANGLSYEELAAALGLNPASVGTLLSRALEAFRKEFIARYGKESYGEK
jgi:RNA polymerase sigma-70 factor (ECF subfamily)